MAVLSYGGRRFGKIFFGDGEESPIFDGSNTYAYAPKVGSVYTLNRDIFLSSATVAAGAELKTGGFRVFCDGRFVNNGIVSANGKPAALGAAGAASTLGSLGVGVAGGAGRANNTGVAGSTQTQSIADGSASGGAGGAGGANAGGSGGLFAPAAANGGADFLFTMQTGCMVGQTSGGNRC